LTAGAWARMHTRVTPGQAAASVRTARVLRSGALPATAAALSAGQISAGHVRVLATGVVDAPAGAVALVEGEALRIARETDVRALKTLLRRFAEALDPDGAEEAAMRRYERRGLTLAPLPDGMVHISGLADEVTGSVLATAIDAICGPPATGDRRTAAQRRLDAAGELARRFLASPDAPSAGGGHAHLIVTVDADTLSANDGVGGVGATLSWVGGICGATARRVGCDAEVTMVGVDNNGAAELLGTSRRFFTAAQRRAMIARDGDRCAAPYCDRPVGWADAHHLTHWVHGGPTTVTNGALPCAAHHTLIHEGGWDLQRLPDGRYTMHDKTGHTIGPEPHPPGHRRPPPHPRT
jgi:Domain of unknown function (DUF222)